MYDVTILMHYVTILCYVNVIHDLLDKHLKYIVEAFNSVRCSTVNYIYIYIYVCVCVCTYV